jgi:hypothetical protein
MSKELELELYKKNRINESQKNYSIKISILNVTLSNNIKIIQRNRMLSAQIKNRNINILISKYFSDVNTFKNQLNSAILYFNNYIPKKVTFSKNKNALLVGINYTGTQNELFGCVNDVNSVKDRLSNNGFTTINTLTDFTIKKPTRENILAEFKKLLVNSQAGDFLVFLYSGHGSYVLDKNGDEKDGYDELIVSCDLQGILDDDLKILISQYLKKDVTLFAMFDCCFSGTILDLKYQFLDSLNYDKYTENEKNIETVGNVYMISGCTEQQTSADSYINNLAQGAMTWSLLESLKSSSNETWRDLIKSMRSLLKTSQYEQIPQFASGNFVDIDSKVFI